MTGIPGMPRFGWERSNESEEEEAIDENPLGHRPTKQSLPVEGFFSEGDKPITKIGKVIYFLIMVGLFGIAVVIAGLLFLWLMTANL